MTGLTCWALAHKVSNGPAHSSDAILAAAQASLTSNRVGGRRLTGNSIGQRSAALRRGETKRKAARLGFGLVAILLLGKLVLGLLVGVLYLVGLLAGVAGIVLLLVMLLRSRPLPVPTLESLRSASPKALVGQTQLWLEAQRPVLPAPALDWVNRIGGQLDTLATQLDRMDDATPALMQVRTLVGEHLPNLVQTYASIPPALRKEAHAGASPDQQLSDSLGRISGEIDSVTRQLAEGKLDALAIQTRYLDYKYGGDV